MKLLNPLNNLVRNIETALQAGCDHKILLDLNDALVDALRKKDSKGNLHYPTPDWDLFPAGRDWFLQH